MIKALGSNEYHVDAREWVVVNVVVGQSPSAFAAWVHSDVISLARRTAAEIQYVKRSDNVIPAAGLNWSYGGTRVQSVGANF